MQKYLSAGDRARIAETIRTAEEKTSGEIYAVLAHRSDDYFFAAGFVAACGVIIASIIAAFLAHWYWFEISLPLFGLAILLAFICVILVIWLVPSIRFALVPHRIRYHRAHLNAMQQFLARNIHVTSKRTGVLLFVSLAERYAEVVADAGINAKVQQKDWNDIVSILTQHASREEVADGFVVGIEKAGKLLARYFPAKRGNPNELGDHVVEL
ncbi:TPM domain-containing protein [Phyllobacterium leguminum]|uniref:Putative membrane protein n=1 Tax=Phyllobacterium leguminum TaxID=314237 RepID=A0A318T2D6_9HYPH|nr:TPM domain-containing protein [Phyllobacterium leguminum]PYE87990.1 putative membrane protein [Phyllobacterium leguminum]